MRTSSLPEGEGAAAFSSPGRRVSFQHLRVLLEGSFHSCFKSKSKAERVEGHLVTAVSMGERGGCISCGPQKFCLIWQFPRGPTITTLCFHFSGPGSIPGRGTKIFASLVHSMANKKEKKKKSLIRTSGLNRWSTKRVSLRAVKLLCVILE